MNDYDDPAARLRSLMRRIALCVSLALAAVWLLNAGLSAVSAQSKLQSIPQATAALDRPDDPVVITGTNFPVFAGVPLTQLVLYAHRGGDWAPIPFQIDQVSISGTYVISGNGLLGSKDELVFMASDAGDSATGADWPADPQARLNPRYAITVTNPLSPAQQAWAYLYRSTTLIRSHVSYITWTYATQTAATLSYTAAFSPTKFVGLSDLFINGRNVDILDRQKLRIHGTFFVVPVDLNEESVIQYTGIPTMSLPIAGPIRAATNVGDLKAAFYRSRIDFNVTLNVGSLPLTINTIRTSFDWISPTISGINTYYDSNTPVGVTIDGVTDTISTTPPIDWFQVNGGAAGPGGLVMTIPDVKPAGGTVTNYYKDDGTFDSSDTGDHLSYGDAGLMIAQPGAVVSLTLSAYILPPGSNANVGSTYFARATHPLQTSVAQESYPYVLPASVAVTGAGVVRVNVPQTYLANVNPKTTTLPITYVWQATDQSPITTTGGLSSSETFTWTTVGLKAVLVTASNVGGLGGGELLLVLVGRPVFLPLVLR